jgi:hypothetical protein
MQLMSPVAKTPDFYLTAIELSLAKDTTALVVERTPAPELILGTQNRESIFRFEMNVHCGRG